MQAFVRDGRKLRREDVYLVQAKRIRFMPKTYTFHARNVYVLLAIRIRPDEKGYTFGPCNR